MSRILISFFLLIFLALPTFAECKSKLFKTTDKEFSDFSKGFLDISLRRDISFDITVDLLTGILTGKWKKETPISTQILKIASPDHLENVEVFVANPIYDDKYQTVKGYYFIVYISAWSKPGSHGRGFCGSGTEYELVVLITDKKGNIKSEKRYLVISCLKPIGGLFIRDSAPENIIYVVYHDSDDLKLLRIDYLFPERGIEEIKGKLLPRSREHH